MKRNMTSKVIGGHIMKTQFFHKRKNDLKCHFYVKEILRDFFIFKPYDLITTLTYVLMDNFCPCFMLNHTNLYKIDE